MKRRTFTFAVLASLAASPLFAGTFTETFTTTTFKDVGNTTTDWNTAAGELRLPPFVPTLVSAYDTPDAARAVAVAGNLAFVATSDTLLRILDISAPAGPVVIGSYGSNGVGYDVAVAGDLAFVAAGFGGLLILDVSDAAAPMLVGTYSPPLRDIRAVAVAGDLALVANDDDGMQILNISDPSTPVLVGSYATSGRVFDVAVTRDVAYVVEQNLIAFNGSLLIIDVSNPVSPTLIGSYELEFSTGLGVQIVGTLAFVANDELRILDVSDPGTPALVGSYDPAGGNISGVTVTGDLAFVAAQSSGLLILDISDPGTPTLAGSFNTPGLAYSVAVEGELAFVADGSSGLQIVNIATAVNPAQVGTYNSSGTANGVAAAGDVAYVADGSSGLRAIDITDPTNPMLLGTYNTSGTASAVAQSGDLAFVADNTSGLQVIDVSDPGSPALVGTYDTPGSAGGVAVDGNHVFVADGTSGLLIVDVSNPASPVLLGSYDTSGTATGVAVAGDHALVADGSGGLRIVDITDPTTPVLLGTYNTVGIALAVAVAGDLAYVADGTPGIQVIDVTNPASPALVGTYNTPGNALNIAVTGDFAFVADGSSGLHVLDITSANPSLLGTFDTSGSATGVAWAGEHVFVADGTSGLHAIQVFQNEVDPSANVGRSLPVDGGATTMVRGRLSSTQSGNVTWELSANGGTNFQPFTPGVWAAFAVPGNDLVWRSTHNWVAPGGNPTASDVTLEWLFDFAVIESVADIPNDEGRRVRVTWTRSGHDFVGDPQQVVEYAIYRQIDPDLSKAGGPRAAANFDGLSLIARTHARMMQASGWDFVTTVPVFLEDSYSVVVPTLADSTIADGEYLSTFRVTALTATPGVFFHSPPDSGYSVDNLAPDVPEGLTVSYGDGTVELAWEPAQAADFRTFRVYRSTDPGFVPGPSTLVHQTSAPSWQDSPGDPGAPTYKVTAVDHAGNESGAATTDEVTDVEPAPVRPLMFALRGATPNPARTLTHIAFDLPTQAAVSLQVFDVSGRVVRTLARSGMPAGTHVVAWDGRDANGHRAPAGVYLYRLRAAGFESTGRLTLVR